MVLLIAPLPETPVAEPKEEKAVEVTGDGSRGQRTPICNGTGTRPHIHVHRETRTFSTWRSQDMLKETDLAACG